MSLSIPPGLFRIFLALAVCVSHLSRLNIGVIAVFIFFMLSGYWSVRMYQEKYRLLANPKTTFWIARFLRIWIIYFFCQITVVIIFALYLGTYDPAYWLGSPLLGLASHNRDILGVAWSLDLEVQFYILVPAIAVLLASAAYSVRLTFVVAIAVCLSVLGWYLIEHYGIVLVLAYLLPFIAGALIYFLNYHVSWRGALISFSIFLLVGLATVFHPATQGILNSAIESTFNKQWFGLAWSLLLIPFVAYNVRQKSSLLDRHLGNLSYTVYLVHFPFYMVAGFVLGNPTPVEKLGLLVMTIPLALVPYFLVDRVTERRRETWAMLLAARVFPVSGLDTP